MPRASSTEVSPEDVEAVFADIPGSSASGKGVLAVGKTGPKPKKARGRGRGRKRDPAARATPGVTKQKAGTLTTRMLRDPHKQNKIRAPKRLLLKKPTSAARLSEPLTRTLDDSKRVSALKRRRTLESRVAEFAEASGGAALLLTVTKGGTARGGRARIAGSGMFKGIENVTLRRVLAYIVDRRVDLWTASEDVTMGRLLGVLASGRPMLDDDISEE